MTSNARELAQIPSTPSGRRNIVINGAMQVAQRGTSVADVGSGSAELIVDRFTCSFGGSTAGRLTMSQDSDSPSGFANSLKLDCTTADTSVGSSEFLVLQTKFEGQDLQRFMKGTSDAKEYALSFYVKANASATYVCELADRDNSRGVSKTFSVTTGWTRVELIFPADTTGAFDDDTSRSLDIQLWLHAGSTYNSGTLQQTWAGFTSANRAVGGDSFFDSTDRTLFITGMQLEVGSVATEFEHRSFGEELALCQRYYHTTDHIAGSTGHAAHILGVFTTIRGFFGIDVPVAMRATPSVSMAGSIVLRTPDLTTEGTLSSVSYYANLNNTRFVLDTAFSTSTANTFRGISIGSNGAFLFDAEL